MGKPSRWDNDALQPRADDSGPKTYDHRAVGPIRRAELRDGDTLLGHVWTDDHEAAGYTPHEAAGPAGRRADAEVWAIHRDAYAKRVPASNLLDPDLYTPLKLSAPKNPKTTSQQADDAIRAAARRK